MYFPPLPFVSLAVSFRSVCEIVGQSDGGLSVLRTFRLLRVLKLVRFMPALRRQLVVLMKTMDNVATFCMLLMLFIFIFRCVWVGGWMFRSLTIERGSSENGKFQASILVRGTKTEGKNRLKEIKD